MFPKSENWEIGKLSIPKISSHKTIVFQTMSLLNSILSTSELMPHTLSIARTLTAKPTSALKKTKALMNQNNDAIKEQIKIEAEAFGHQLQSVEVKEAINAFFEKREPNFTNL